MLTAVAAFAIAGATAIGVSMKREELPAARPQTQRPTLALLTSLPLVFGESFGLESGGSAALTRLEQRYNVLPIGVADAASLEGQKLLLMAHPRAQPAEALVELDQWVRGGGRVLLLADPKLDWRSERPPGDKLRAPPAFADTGLLGHWGLRLIGLDASSAGRLESQGGCIVAADGLIARCPIGRGQATVIADADFLNAEQPAATDLDMMIVELDRLETR
jgi:hypothetical protein